MKRDDLLGIIHDDLQIQGTSALGDAEYKKFLEKNLSIEIKPYTQYSIFDDFGNYLGDSEDFLDFLDALEPSLTDMGDDSLLEFAKELQQQTYGKIVSDELKGE